MIQPRPQASSSRRHFLSRHALSAAVLSVLLGTPLGATAQVTPDPNGAGNHPSTDTAANGVPVVNINAPTASGVSHNEYQVFNVDPHGLILNNSAGVSSTQLAGYITGNPHFHGGQAARVIVNEVTSTNPSVLRGYTEVAGHAADVIIANPNGISVDGAGFINTPRAVLTTGESILGGDGSLQGFRVTRGHIRIDGAGLDASNIDRLDLLSRSLSVQSKVWAKQLNVVTGANRIHHADLSAQAIAGEGDTPLISLDVAALGGMYAHAIRLIGTEAGLGVHNAGQLATQSGDFTINQAGQLVLTGITSSAGHLAIQSGSIHHSGTLQSAGHMTLQASGDVTNTGTVYSAGNLNLSAGNTLTHQGTLAAANDTILRARQFFSQGTLGAGIAGDGSLQGHGALDIATSGGLVASGNLLAAGNLTLQGSALNLAGAQTQAGGNATLTATGGDILYTQAALDTAGTLTLQSAGKLDTTGSMLRSDGAQTVNVAGDALLHGTHWAGGNAQWRVGGTLSSNGTVAAQGNLTLDAGQLDAHGILAAGLRADGSLTGTAQLAATSRSALTATGQNIASGSLDFTGDAINLAGATTRAGGDLTLTARQGDIDHSNGDLAANGRLDVHAKRSIINTQGLLQAQQLAIQGGDLDNRRGQLLQTGAGTTTLTLFGTVDNTQGHIATNASDLSITAGALDNTAGTLAHAGSGSFSIATTRFTNTQGKLAGNGNLLLSGTTIANTHGTLSMAGGATLGGTSLDNTGGTIVAQTLDAALDGAFTNQSGLVQADGPLQLGVGTLTNGSGQIKALNGTLDVSVAHALSNATGGFLGSNHRVNLAAGTLSNAGQIYAGDDLTLTTQGDAANQGALQALGHLDANIGGALRNDGGKLEAGNGQAAATLTLHAATLSNQNGRIANTDNGLTQITAQTLSNLGGTVGGQGDVALEASQLTNTAGTLVAGGNLTLRSQAFSNQRGTLYSAGNFNWIHHAATLDNTQGSIGAGGDLSLALAAAHNEGGDIAANGNVAAQFGAFDGTGRLRAGQDLQLTLGGDYINQAGNTLFANRNFIFNVGGTLTNRAKLESVGALTVNAAQLDNQASATINSATTTLTTAGAQRNAGRIDGDTIALHASDFANTGTVIGNSIAITANNLTNGADLGSTTGTPGSYDTALIAAVQRLDLYVGDTLLNRDATLYALGDLTIAADANGTRSRAVTNLSGAIEADGNLSLSAQQFTNQRRVFQTEVYQLTPSEQAQNTSQYTLARYLWNDPDPTHRPPYIDPSQVIDSREFAVAKGFCDRLVGGSNDKRCSGYPFGQGQPDTFQGAYTSTLTSITRIAAASAESRLLAGGNITLNGSVLNDTSTIAAGRNLTINGQDGGQGGGNVGGDTVRNIAWIPTGTVRTTLNEQTATQVLVDNPRHWEDGPWMSYGTQLRDDTVPLGPGQVPAWITFPIGPGATATMSAGQAVSITAEHIDNTPVGADGNPVSGVGLGANDGRQTLQGQNGGGIARVGGIAGPVPGVQTLGTPDQPWQVSLPNGGLYTLHPGSGRPYLVETDPRFASYAGFLGSDYLLNRLGLDGDATLKRLGDAFYETRLVLDQITSLTGRRYLTADTDNLAQYKALMDAGVEEAQRFQLSVGVALTPEQMAQLTQDMVWLVRQDVGGESVLVPVVYLSQQTANSIASGAVIQGSTVSLNASGSLTNTGTIQASRDASLKAGHLLNAGTLSAGGNLSVQAAQDLLNAGTIQGGNVALVAGNHLASGVSGFDPGTFNLGGLNLNVLAAPSVPGLNLPQGGAITANGNLTAQAGHNLTLDHAAVSAGNNLGLAAGNNLTATASTLSAGQHAQLIAGNDMNLNAAGHTQRQGTAMNGIETTTHTVTTLTAGGSAVLAAGHDLASQGAQLKAGGQLALSAGHDLTLNAVTDRAAQSSEGTQGHTVIGTRQVDEALRGSQLSGSNGVALSAGHDLTAVAASITSDQGAIALAAGHDIHLLAGQENHTWQQDTVTQTSGLLGSRRTTTHDAVQDSYAVGSLLSGQSVTVAAGHDLTTQAAQIVGTNNVVLAAGNNVNIGTATSTHSEQHSQTQSQSGMFGAGLGVMIGSAKQSQRYTETSTTPQGSLVGSLNGSVTLTAGNLVHITGSDVLSQTGTAIVGKDVTIDAAVGTRDTTQTTKQQSSGLTVGVGGAMAQAVQGVMASAQRGSEVSDDRLKALYAAQAAYGASDALGVAKAGGLQGATKPGPDGQGGNANGLNLQIGLGGSSASSTTTTHDEQAYGSRLSSQGHVTIAATGGDLNVIGSQINGHDVALAAANNLNLLSQAEHHSLDNQNKNASGGVGVQIGSDGAGFFAQASAGKGSAHGNGTTHAISSVNADGTLTLISGHDTTLQGAQLTGNQVIAAIGNNLTIRSEQDTDDYVSKQQQLGMKGVIGYGSGGSVNVNQSKVDSHYQSVTDISGIQAGSGGFDITVGGNTHLAGGVIASSAEARKNVLDTGSLTYEHLKNEANYSASSTGLSAGYGSEGFNASPSLGMPQSGHSSSETKAGVAQGTIIVRDGNADLSGLDRNPTLADQTLTPIFDAQKVQEQMEMGQLMGQVGMRAAGDLAGKMGWPEGSPERTLLHGLVGVGMAALGGGDVTQAVLGAGANQLVIQKMAEFLESQGYEKGTPEFATMLQLGSAAIGAAVGEGSGAAAALAGTQYNYLTHLQTQQFEDKLAACGSDKACQDDARQWAKNASLNNDIAMTGMCGANPSDTHCLQAIKDSTRYNLNSNMHTLIADDQMRSTNALLQMAFDIPGGQHFFGNIDSRKDFFNMYANAISAKGDEVAWPRAAAQVSADLQKAWWPILDQVGGVPTQDWINQTGNTILDYRWNDLKSLYESSIPLTGSTAFNWDIQTLRKEQGQVQWRYDQLNGRAELGVSIGAIAAPLLFHGDPPVWNVTDPNARVEKGQEVMQGIRNDPNKSWEN